MSGRAGIYIHVPFCAKKCPYCDFYSLSYTKADADRCTDAVCRNLNALPEKLAADTVYFGGGTPSLLQDDALARMLNTIQKRCDLAADAEITIEANPLTMTAHKLSAWRRIGINRISVGIQSFQADVLRILGRKHTPEQGRAAILCAFDAGFANISLDLMTGLAVQTADIWQADLETAISLPVTHLSAYLLKIEEQTAFGSHPPALLDDDETADRYLQMHDFLTANGYSHYEISNFAKPGCESRHNCKYWRLEPYYGIGPAAHSCHDGKRYAVPRDLDAFCAADRQPETVTAHHADTEIERIMLGLRLAEGISADAVPDSRAQLLRNAAPLIPRYLTQNGNQIQMQPEGWLVSNAVLAQLLRGIDL